MKSWNLEEKSFSYNSKNFHVPWAIFAVFSAILRVFDVRILAVLVRFAAVASRFAFVILVPFSPPPFVFFGFFDLVDVVFATVVVFNVVVGTGAGAGVGEAVFWSFLMVFLDLLVVFFLVGLLLVSVRFVVVVVLVVRGWEGVGRVIFDEDGCRSWIFGAGGTDRMLDDRLKVGRLARDVSTSLC